MRLRLGCDDPCVPFVAGGSLVECWACGGKREDCPVCREYDLGTHRARAVFVPRCPRRAATSDVCQMLNAYGMFKSGMMPIVGGWLDQSSTYVEAMRFIGGLISTHEKAELDG